MKKVVFVFPGQGSQYQGMGKKIYYRNKIVREIFEEASDILGRDMKKLCFDTNIGELTQTKNAQPAIFTVSYATFKLYMESGIEPSLLAGHSLGEFTALTCSGAISFSDTIRLVQARGNIMQTISEKSIGTMAAVTGAKKDFVEELCRNYSKDKKKVNISNYNSKEQLVLSGNLDSIEEIGEIIKKNKYKFTKLQVSAPFHSELMNGCVEEFYDELKKYSYHEMKYPVISNVTAKPYENSSEIISILKKHIVSPVLWEDTISYFYQNGIETAVELGPKHVLRNLVTKCTDTIEAFSYDDDLEKLEKFTNDYTGRNFMLIERENKLQALFEDIKEKTKELYKEDNFNLLKLDNNKQNKVTAVTLCLANAICVPNKNTNEDEYEYENAVVKLYKNIRKIQANIEKEDRKPNENEVEEAFQMLYSVFKAKRASIDEQEIRIKEIYNRLSQCRL